MKTFVTAAGFAVGASAAILPRTDGCCFQLTASGGVSGTLGQLDDGQNRVGGGLGSATYCINGDTITDGSGRGCILTAPTTQFQCDKGASPDGGFSVDSDGMLQHDGDNTFYACPADQGEYNIYTEAVNDQPKCVEVSLSTGGKCASGGQPQSSAGSTCPPAQTITKTEQGKPSTVYTTETQAKPTTVYKTETKAVPTTVYKTETQYNTAYKTETQAVPTTIYKTETVQNTKLQPTTVYQTKTVEETETATKPTTIYQTKTIQTTETAQQPTTVYKTKTVEETETATRPTTVYQTSTVQQTETAPPTTVYKTKTEEETETATKPTTIYETKTIQQTVTAQQPTTVYNTKTVEETETQQAQPTTVYKTKTEQAPPSTITKAVTQVVTQQGKPQTVTKTEECSQTYGGGKPTHGGGKPTQTNEGSACPTDLSGPYQYPHLIVPVSSEHPDQGYGTSYNGMMNSSMSSVFNFDIPKDYEGQSCSLVFMLPKKSDLETSDYTFNGQGSVSVDHLSSACSKDTTWNSVPSVDGHMGSFSPQPGNSYVVSTDSCAAGTTQSYELSAAGGLDLEYFQDYNPSPIGLYITAC